MAAIIETVSCKPNDVNQSLLCLEWLKCPLSLDYLFKPIIAEDDQIYNELIFINLFKNETTIISPITKKRIGKTYKPVRHIRNVLIDFIIKTSILDKEISSMSYDIINDFDLFEILESCNKNEKHAKQYIELIVQNIIDENKEKYHYQ